MIDNDATAETLLIVRLSSPRPVAGLAPVDEHRLRLKEELSFVQALVTQGRGCCASRVTGDELQAIFCTGDDAFEAAGMLQQVCSESGRSATLSHLHLLLDRPKKQCDTLSEATYFPETTAVQSKLIHQLPPDWLFATSHAIDRLSDACRARFHTCGGHADDDEVDVAGLYRAILHEDSTTRIATSTRARMPAETDRSLSLRWRNHTRVLRRDSPSLTLGRSEQADVQIESTLASRMHARILVQQSDFILCDQSTNGTFIEMTDTDEINLQNEQIVLRGNGVISLGRPISLGRGKLIYFTLSS